MAKKNINHNISTLIRRIKSKPLDRELGFGKNVTLNGRLMPVIEHAVNGMPRVLTRRIGAHELLDNFSAEPKP